VPFSSEKKRPHRLIVALAASLVVASLAAVAGWIALPRIIESRIASTVSALSNRVPGTLAHGEITLHEGWKVDIDSLDWVSGEDWSLQAKDLAFTVDPISILFGRPRLDEVDVGHVSIRLGRPGAPFKGPAEALARVRTLLHPGGSNGGGARLGGRLIGGGAVPRLKVRAVKADVQIDGPWAVTVSGGVFDVGPPVDSLDGASAVLKCEIDFSFRDGVARKLNVEGLMDPSAGVRKLTADVDPPVDFEKGGYGASLSGLSYRPGELHVLNPSWSLEKTFALTADEIAFRWGENQDVGGGRPDEAGPEVLALPKQLRALMKGLRIVQVEFFRPIVNIELPGLGDTASVNVGSAKAAKDGGRKEGVFRSDVERMTRFIERGLGVFRRDLSRLAARLPPGKVLVHGATIRYLTDGRPVPGPSSSLANLDATVARTLVTGRVTGRLRFECPEATSGANEVDFDLDPIKGDGKVTVRASYLPLHPYRGFMPKWFIVAPGTILKDCDLEMRMEGGDGKLEIGGGLKLAHAGLFIPGLASRPLHDMEISLAGRFSIEGREGKLGLHDGLLGVGAIRMPFSIDITSMENGPEVKLEARIERLKAQDLIESIPKEMIPALEGVRLSGSFAASLKLDVNTRDMKALKFDFKPDVADLRVLDPGKGANLQLLQHQFLHRIEESGGRVVRRFIGPSSSSWVSLDEVPRYLISALTTSEDSQFFKHHGFSLGGIRRSLRVNLERGGFYQGASTLSQQLVKNLFLSSEKTLARKLQEAFITWQLERFLSKDRILELYLNVVEWGPDSHGLREAAMHYFGKTPSELSLLEAAYLVCIIPNPRGYHAYYERGVVPPAFMRRVRRLLKEMAARGLLSQENLERAQGQRIRFALTTPTKDQNTGTGEDDSDGEFSDD